MKQQQKKRASITDNASAPIKLKKAKKEKKEKKDKKKVKNKKKDKKDKKNRSILQIPNFAFEQNSPTRHSSGRRSDSVSPSRIRIHVQL